MNPTEQINLYIAEHPEWQRKLLVRIRQLIHGADEHVQENWRWNMPHFDHSDHIMIGMAAFKEHVAVWFHKGALIKDPKKLFEKADEKGMRSYKIKEGDALNEAAFTDLVKKAVALNTKGTKLGDAKPAKKALVVPDDLMKVLEHDEQAMSVWSKASYSWKKEYVEWITDAKKEETRKRRIAEAYQMIREGVGLNDRHTQPA
jgi:hypothetical protein